LHFSSGNLATIFHAGEPASTIPVATTAYVPPKQPKKGIFLSDKNRSRDCLFFFIKDSAPKVMIATLVQTFSL